MTYLYEALVQGSLLLLMVSLIICLLHRVLSPGGKLLLHKLVYLRFLLPGLFLLSLNSSHFFEDSASLMPESKELSLRPELKTNTNPEYIADVSVDKAFEWPLFEMWLYGVCLCLAFMLYLNLTQRKKLNSRKQLGDNRAQTLLGDCCHQLCIKNVLGLSESSHLSSPALYGLIKPEIILPHGLLNQLSEEELKHVFLHELSHFKKADNWWNCFFSLIHIINWYNPLVWYFRSKTQELQEQACDARVIRDFVDAKAYGSTLIKVVEQSNLEQNPSLCAVVYLNENKKQLKRRIQMLKTKQNKCGLTFAVLLMTSLACLGWGHSSESVDDKNALKVKPALKGVSPVNSKIKKQILIKSQFIEGEDKVLSAPSVMTEEDSTAIIRVVQEKYLPESWEKPRFKEKQGNLSFTPAKPIFGDITDIGVSLEVKPSLLEHPKFSGQVHLSGKVILIKMVDSKITQVKIHEEQTSNVVMATETQEAIFSLLTTKDKVSEINISFEGKALRILLEAKVVEEKL
ncbi:M56 family metallopeptidase [Lentisphaera marina]|uniref:M56 family metallopeptidase n=1 Tax=Lentisphaera marina TaxID=1111041 RepID=UPI002365D4E9|nr:M56 family metallopeptidase [Lentisphaera marina]MDD7987284.1 M56 family metallopeptidase [Lentisphaera marina]